MTRDLDLAAPGDRRPRAGRGRGTRDVVPAVALQRTVGNRAAGRTLARTAPVASRTGLRSSAQVNQFARKAVWFYEHNPDLELSAFANYLGAAANVALGSVGCPDVHVSIGRGTLDAAAEFNADLWTMVLNPEHFSRQAGVEKIRDLDRDEAALIAMTVYHEARHAEQNFRVARLREARHELSPIDPIADSIAEHHPLDSHTGSPAELREARTWETNLVGDDAVFREVVSSWTHETLTAARLTHHVDAAGAGAVRERIGEMIRAWGKPGGRIQTLRGHLPSATKRHAGRVLRDTRAISDAFTRAERAWKQLDDGSPPAAFKPLADALAKLHVAVTTAYHNQPVEDDAAAAGTAVHAAFKALKNVKHPR